jgi:hypothetical protein
MQLQFVPVEDFYFALTLCNKPLEEIDDPVLTGTVKALLQDRFGQSSTVASAQQNTFHYVFRVQNVDHHPAPQLVVSISDWHDKLRLNSDFGWTLDSDRKPMRTEKFPEREQFAQKVKAYLRETLQLPLKE